MSGPSGRGQPVSPYGIDSIQPGVPCPELVLVGVMIDGSVVLVAHPQCMPVAFVAAGDADPLRRALEAAFGNLTGDPGSNPGAVGPHSSAADFRDAANGA